MSLRRHASSHGIVYKGLEHDLSVLMKKKDGVVNQLGKGVRALVTKKGGLRVELTARKSEGSYSGHTTLFAIRKHIVHSDHGIAFEEVPSQMAVIGAGAIGLELGCVWSRLGTKVEIIEFLPEICPQLDPGMSKVARKIFEKQGLTFRLSTKVISADIGKSKATLTTESEKGTEEISVDRVLVAVGRSSIHRWAWFGRGGRHLG